MDLPENIATLNVNFRDIESHKINLGESMLLLSVRLSSRRSLAEASHTESKIPVWVLELTQTPTRR
jgi:hypothetical protein